MATDVGHQGYYGWSQEEELSDGEEHHEISVSQVLDHGSISFGRFASEPLSWEKRSVFIHDRRLEELEKFNGLVAKKKAYFEERYQRLRALKASQQQGQQTELILDYGSDSSNSSQSGVEEYKSVPKHNLQDEREINSHTLLEEAKVECAFEQKINVNEAVQTKEFDTEHTFPDVNSSVGSLDDVDQDRTYHDDTKLKISEKELSTVRENMEENKPNHSTSLDNEEIIRKQESLKPSYKHGTAGHRSVLDSKSSKGNQLQSKKFQGNKTVPKAKEFACGVRTALTMKQETKLDNIRSSRAANDTSLKMVNKAESSHFSRKTTLTGANSNRSTSVASNRQLRETRSNINTQGPNTPIVERRASSSGIKARTDSRILNKSASPIYASGGLCVQDTSKTKAATSEVKKIIGPENKRVLKEPQKRPSSSDNRTNLKRTEAPRLAPSSRSVNLPAKSKHGCTSRTDTQFGTIKVTKQTRGREEIRLRDSQRVSTKTIVASTYGNTRIAAKPSQLPNAEVVRTARKQRVNSLSLDGSKTR